ncbi:hypothetical protein F7725_015382 [Dissostichus mawsoni]|uniref:Katanin p60 ATPase-containing subunit A-like 2 n=1 Tax=Dissostichus mawsoni TaxID=36200 RepID=A0A7J5YHF5_DISMA|nr:hypothetical protein F7725_015382 [Dissostichus mawsoni]
MDQETNGGVRRFEVCDNIDLEMVLMEYESYHYVKFQKYPKLIRRTAELGENRNIRSGGESLFSCEAPSQNHPLPEPAACSRSQEASCWFSYKCKTSKHNNHDQNMNLKCDYLTSWWLCFQENGSSSSEFGLNVSSIRNGPAGEAATNRKGQMTEGKVSIQGTGSELDHMERLLKPLSGLSGMSGEMRELAAIISGDIYLHSPNVRWEDIIGLEDAKRLVKEAVVYPIKTLLAKAVATECKTTFFNISASSIVSKWRGDSEKLVRVLFELARYHAPSTIFLDELESVMSQRGANMGGEHEGSRRMKTELLVQMDGLARSEDLVFVLAASNLPWELDHAMLRRLEKRILVGLPSSPARQAMISHWLPPLSCTGGVELRTELDYETLAKLVCKEAAMRPVRKIFDALESHQDGGSNMPVIQLETVTTADFLEVLTHTKPSARNLMDRYTAWDREYKSV